MKKIYQNPETMVVKVQTVHMIATSDQLLRVGGNYNGTATIESRRGRNSFWDEEDEE